MPNKAFVLPFLVAAYAISGIAAHAEPSSDTDVPPVVSLTPPAAPMLSDMPGEVSTTQTKYLVRDDMLLSDGENPQAIQELLSGSAVDLLLNANGEPFAENITAWDESGNGYLRTAVLVQAEDQTGYVWEDCLTDTAPVRTAVEDDPLRDESASSDTAVQTAASAYSGQVLTASAGRIAGPSGEETYYNLDMSGVVANTKAAGIAGDYWVRGDGVKMYGDYILAACDISGMVHSRYDIVETSLGSAICADTGGFAASNPSQIDIATSW